MIDPKKTWRTTPQHWTHLRVDPELGVVKDFYYKPSIVKLLSDLKAPADATPYTTLKTGKTASHYVELYLYPYNTYLLGVVAKAA